MKIGVVGDPEDLASVYVSWLAGCRGIEVLPLPESTLGSDWSFNLNEETGEAWLRLGEQQMEFTALSGLFVRLHPEPQLPRGLALAAAHHLMFLRERREGLHHLLEALPCAVVNRPSAGRANASKPYQMRMLGDAGFRIPRWVVTNDFDVAVAFVDACPDGAIYKAVSGLRSRVRAVDEELMSRLKSGTTATVLQEYVPGRDVRVHTVGSLAFATEVRADGVDYRYQNGSEYRATEVGVGLAELCCAHACAEGLMLAGFDFRVTEAGIWHCLEMNPVPSFLPYEMCSGLPIADAILDVLTGCMPASAKRMAAAS